MDWTFPWASSFGTDFNADFNVWFTEEQWREGLQYNYQREPGYSRDSAAHSGAFQWREGQGAGEEQRRSLPLCAERTFQCTIAIDPA